MHSPVIFLVRLKNMCLTAKMRQKGFQQELVQLDLVKLF